MLIGYTADEPQIRNFPNSKVANITVVTNESQKNNETGVYESVPEWHRVSLWYRNADVVEQYVHKGTQVYIEGKIRTRSYTDKTGVKRYSTEIVGDQIILLSSRRDYNQPPIPPIEVGIPLHGGQNPQGGSSNGSIYQNGPGFDTTVNQPGPDFNTPVNQPGQQRPPYYDTTIGTTDTQGSFPQTLNVNNVSMNGGVSGSYVSHVPQDPFRNGSNNALDPNKSPWNQQANQFNTNSMNNANSFAGSSSTSAMPEMASGSFDQGAVPVSASVSAPAPEPAPIPAQTPTFEQGGGDEDIPF